MFKILTSSIFRQIYATFVFVHASFLLGFLVVFPACLIPQLKQERVVSNTLTESILGSIVQFVACFGTLFTTIFVGKVGRKKILQISLLWYAAGMSIVCISKGIPILCFGLSVASLIISFIHPVIVAYISETCPKENRAVLISASFVFINFGGAVVYLLGDLLTWRTTAWCMVGVALLGFLQTFLIPETVYWYLLNADKGRAAASLQWFEPNFSAANVQRKMDSIHQSIDDDPNAKSGHFIELVKNLRYKKYLKPALLGLIIAFVRSGNGRVIFGVYFTDILRQFKIPYNFATLRSMFGLVEMIGSVLVLVLIHKCNRKRVIYMASGILVASSAVVVVYKFLHNYDIKAIPPWTAVFCLYTYSLISMAALNSSLSVILSEIQHAYYRAEMSSLFSGATFLFLSSYSFLFPHVQKVIAIEYTFMYFAANVILTVVVIFFFFPETSKFEFFETKKKVRRTKAVAERT